MCREAPWGGGRNTDKAGIGGVETRGPGMRVQGTEVSNIRHGGQGSGMQRPWVTVMRITGEAWGQLGLSGQL